MSYTTDLLSTGKRRYDRKQAGFGGQTKPVFHKKVIMLLPSVPLLVRCCLLSGCCCNICVNTAGEDHKEDCVEAGMPIVQGCAHAPD